MFLYVTDLKDRCRHEDWVRAHQRRHLQQQPSLNAVEGITAVQINASTKRNSYTNSSTVGNDRPTITSSRGMIAFDSSLLPPMRAQDDLLDPMDLMCLEYPVRFSSFSQVSTITGSYFGDGSPDRELLEEYDVEQQSLGITELNEIYRLSQHEDLRSLIAGQRQAMSSNVSGLSSSASSRGCSTVADPNELVTMRPTSNHETATGSVQTETTSSIKIVGLAPPHSSEGMCDDGSATMDDEDIYILQIHCVDGDTMDCNEHEDSGGCVSSGASSSTESVSVISGYALASPLLTGEMMYASDITETPSKRCSPSDAPNLQGYTHVESRDVEDNQFASICETSEGFEVEQDHRIEAPRRNKLLQLEELISSIPFDHLTKRIAPCHTEENCIVLNAASPINEFVRDIYFVPVSLSDSDDELLSSSSPSKLGLQINDASSMVTHPAVAKVAINSPLAGRIIEGDYILRVNDAETAGFSAESVHRLIQCIQQTPLRANAASGVAKMIKLTVMTSQSDCPDDLSEDSIDLGILETALEV
jgi:hypothetical protein